MTIFGLIFDFDGLVVDTEGAVYQSWQELYREHGFELSFDAWATIIGTTEAHFDPLENLQSLLGRKVDDEVMKQREQREQALIQLLPLLPGVEAILQDAHRLGLKVGLASSSPCSWVERHLNRLGLIDYFDVIRASDDVQRTKPDPELYLAVLQALGLQPDEAIAFEDSPNGAWAARRAGLFCVAIPNPLTRRLNLEHANLRLSSLSELPLADLINNVSRGEAGVEQ